VTFDPSAEREPLAETLAILRAQTPAQFPGALGHAAVLAVAIAVRSWLVGLRDGALPVLAQRRDWLRRSLENDESFGDTPLLTAARIADTLALTTWLLDDGHDTAAYREAVARYERYFASDEPRVVEAAVDLARVRAEAGVRVDEPRLLTPDDARTPLELAYSAARWPRSPRIVPAGELVIAMNAEQWLDLGAADQVAAWLKIGYWDTGVTRTPEETLQRLPRLLPRRS
jgi:hypothetical protein